MRKRPGGRRRRRGARSSAGHGRWVQSGATDGRVPAGVARWAAGAVRGGRGCPGGRPLPVPGLRSAPHREIARCRLIKGGIKMLVLGACTWRVSPQARHWRFLILSATINCFIGDSRSALSYVRTSVI